MIDDEKIIALFWARSEEAIQELDSKYGKICNKLSYNILSDTQDAEECVNDAYDRKSRSFPFMVGKLLLFISLHPLPGGHCLGNSGYILCADQSRNHTARELAERFQVSETSLKNYFRGVFGENLSIFLREARMRRAAKPASSRSRLSFSPSCSPRKDRSRQSSSSW